MLSNALIAAATIGTSFALEQEALWLRAFATTLVWGFLVFATVVSSRGRRESFNLLMRVVKPARAAA